MNGFNKLTLVATTGLDFAGGDRKSFSIRASESDNSNLYLSKYSDKHKRSPPWTDFIPSFL